MRKYIFCFWVVVPGLVWGQSLGEERVDRLRNCVVRILVESKPVGTGFFIDSTGQVATCWHVIAGAVKLDSFNNPLGQGIISVFSPITGTIDYTIPDSFLNNGYADAFMNDFVFLSLAKPIKIKFPYLKIGNFDHVNDGDEVYMCGYPLGITQPFISKGMVSTKFIEGNGMERGPGKHAIANVKKAWLDITMNIGNSGGPVIKFGEKPADDEVIGIAAFIYNPFADSNLSFGIGGCVSINPLVESAKRYRIP